MAEKFTLIVYRRSNALPLIQRGVYKHCAGRNTGKPYEINYITKVVPQYNYFS